MRGRAQHHHNVVLNAKCTNAQMHKCQMHKCQMPKCQKMHKCPNAKNAQTQLQREIQSMDVQLHNVWMPKAGEHSGFAGNAGIQLAAFQFLHRDIDAVELACACVIVIGKVVD